MSSPPHPLNPSTLPIELLELILSHLPPKDLLLSQRTSLTFRNAILGSSKLQKALFLTPDWTPHSAHVYTDGKTEICKPENNRLLLRAFPGCYPTVTLVIVNDGRGEQHTSQALPNDTDTHHASETAEQWTWDVHISFPSDGPPPSTHPSVLYPRASWRRMFLSQPPCTSLHLVRRWQRSMNPAIVRVEGIRMGEFVEEAGRSGARRRDSAVVAVGGRGVGTGDGQVGRGAVGEVDGWHPSYISSDRDWHFEGNIRYEDCSALRVGGGDEEE